jgi:hypothetical protein
MQGPKSGFVARAWMVARLDINVEDPFSGLPSEGQSNLMCVMNHRFVAADVSRRILCHSYKPAPTDVGGYDAQTYPAP